MKINTVGWILIALASTIILVTVIGAYSVSQKIHSVSTSWEKYRDQKSPKRLLLAELNKTIGYGGFIHDFKNMILRNDRSLYKKIHNNFGHAQSVIDRYRLININDQEIIALDDIEEMLDNYIDMTDRIVILHEEGKTPKEIDTLVKINDTRAVEGLALLDHPAVDILEQFDTRPELILEIRKVLGYGGVIHNFKNYVLRNEHKYYQKTMSGITKGTDLLEYYGNKWTDPVEQQSIDTILGVITNYRRALDHAVILKGKGKTPEEIDKAIRIDDQPALLALTAMDRANELQTASNEKAINKNLHEANFLVKITPCTIIVVTIMLLALLSWLLRTQIIWPVKQITLSIKRLLDGNLSLDKDDELLYRGDNEIGQMNQVLDAFRNNAIELAKAKEVAEWSQKNAEKANKAKSIFLSNMSHELRTPLNAILGFSQILEMGSNLDDEQISHVQDILRSGNHLLVLINDVLDLAKIEAGKINIDLVKVNIKEILDDCTTFISPLATKYNVGIHIEPANDFLVMADRTRLKQSLLNLISNAAKYNKPGGSVRIACIEKQGCVRIEITDTGKGLTREQQEKLFKSFERLSDDSEVIEGTGIGLVITKQLIELMGGLVGVTSNPGEGSTFWIELGCAAEEQTNFSVING